MGFIAFRRPVFIPSALETWGVVFTSLLLLLLGNARIILHKLGLTSSTAVVKSQVGHTVVTNLNKLDSFTITRGAITYALWGGLGLLAFGFVYVLVQTLERIKYRKAFTSDQYLHPVSFDRTSFWHQAMLNALRSFGLLLALIAGCVAYLFWAIPLSFTDIRRFLSDSSLAQTPHLLTGLATALATTYILYSLMKLVAWNRRRSKI